MKWSLRTRYDPLIKSCNQPIALMPRQRRERKNKGNKSLQCNLPRRPVIKREAAKQCDGERTVVRMSMGRLREQAESVSEHPCAEADSLLVVHTLKPELHSRRSSHCLIPKWWRRVELNYRQAAYETAALPLSYAATGIFPAVTPDRPGFGGRILPDIEPEFAHDRCIAITAPGRRRMRRLPGFRTDRIPAH